MHAWYFEASGTFVFARKCTPLAHTAKFNLIFHTMHKCSSVLHLQLYVTNAWYFLSIWGPLSMRYTVPG